MTHPGAPDVVGAFAPELKNPPLVLPKTVDGEEIRVEEVVGSIEFKKLYMAATPLPSLGASAPTPSATWLGITQLDVERSRMQFERMGAYMDFALEADIASQGWDGYGSEWE